MQRFVIRQGVMYLQDLGGYRKSPVIQMARVFTHVEKDMIGDSEEYEFVPVSIQEVK